MVIELVPEITECPVHTDLSYIELNFETCSTEATDPKLCTILRNSSVVLQKTDIWPHYFTSYSSFSLGFCIGPGAVNIGPKGLGMIGKDAQRQGSQDGSSTLSKFSFVVVLEPF